MGLNVALNGLKVSVVRSRLRAGGKLIRHGQLWLYLPDHRSQVALCRRRNLDIPPLSAGVIRLEAETSGLDAARITDCDRCCLTVLSGCTNGEITVKGEKLEVIPLLRRHTGGHRLGSIFSPPVICPPHHQRVIEVAQSGHVAVVGIYSLFFVAGADNQPCITVLPEQENIGFNRVVGPVFAAGHQLGSALIGNVAHHAVGVLPCAAKCLPILLFLERDHLVLRRPTACDQLICDSADREQGDHQRCRKSDGDTPSRD